MQMRSVLFVAALSAVSSAAMAVPVSVRVTVQNLAPTNSVSFAPFRLAFNKGTFDTFNNGQAAFLLGHPSIATAPIVTVAAGGSGSTWFPAWAANEPTAVTGTVVPSPAGALTPGLTGSSVFTVDPAVNPFFTFGSMVVPSNDYFIGNDSPSQYRLFNANGSLAITTIGQKASDIWDAGSEQDILANAAFVVGGTNSQRVDQNGVVGFDFADLATVFNGATTAAGYVFNSQLTANSDIYRISFAVVPEPTTLAAAAGTALLAARRRR